MASMSGNAKEPGSADVDLPTVNFFLATLISDFAKFGCLTP
jgi:hypothetical protein